MTTILDANSAPAYSLADGEDDGLTVITAEQLAAIQRLAEVARHVARLLPPEARRRLLDAADQVAEA